MIRRRPIKFARKPTLTSNFSGTSRELFKSKPSLYISHGREKSSVPADNKLNDKKTKRKHVENCDLLKRNLGRNKLEITLVVIKGDRR